MPGDVVFQTVVKQFFPIKNKKPSKEEKRGSWKASTSSILIHLEKRDQKWRKPKIKTLRKQHSVLAFLPAQLHSGDRFPGFTPSSWRLWMGCHIPETQFLKLNAQSCLGLENTILGRRFVLLL